MKGFRKERKSGQVLVDLASGELLAEQDAPYVRPPWHRSRLVFHCTGETRTQQHHKDLTDINHIVSRYARTSEMPPAKSEPSYADVTGLQGDLGERIIASREVIEKSDRYLSDKQKEKAKADKEKEAKSAPPPDTGAKKNSAPDSRTSDDGQGSSS